MLSEQNIIIYSYNIARFFIHSHRLDNVSGHNRFESDFFTTSCNYRRLLD